jgi:hypothetical protein
VPGGQCALAILVPRWLLKVNLPYRKLNQFNDTIVFLHNIFTHCISMFYNYKDIGGIFIESFIPAIFTYTLQLLAFAVL